MKVGSIYIIRNTVNNKVYIGQTTMLVSERFAAHIKPSTSKRKRGYKLYNAMNKYGSDKFYVETLEENVPIEKLNGLETEYIYKYDSYNNGYNSTPGGDGRTLSKIEREDELLRLAKLGMNTHEIALIFGCHHATVIRTLHKLGFRYHYDENKIIELSKGGMKNKDIAELMNCHPYTVCRILDRRNERKYRVPVKNRSIDIEAIRSDYDAQMPITEICTKYNISKTVFYRIKSENNFHLRPQIYKYKTRYYD